MPELDLFSDLSPACGDCVQLDPKPLDSGIRYCWGELSWRWPQDRVHGCSYRDRGRIAHPRRPEPSPC